MSKENKKPEIKNLENQEETKTVNTNSPKNLIDMQNRINAKFAPKDPQKILQEIGKLNDSIAEMLKEFRILMHELKGDQAPKE